MREKLRRFMAGRYGNDSLNQALSILSMILLVISLFSRINLFWWLALGLLIYLYFRMLSRNIPARTAENYKFYSMKENVANWWKSCRGRWSSRRVYRYYTCPKCRQKLRVPRGRGRLQISCPRCGTQFVKKS